MKSRSKSPSNKIKKQKSKSGSHLIPQTLTDSSASSSAPVPVPGAGPSTTTPVSASPRQSLPNNSSAPDQSVRSLSHNQSHSGGWEASSPPYNSGPGPGPIQQAPQLSENLLSLLSQFNFANHKPGTPLKRTALFCTRKLYLAICSGDIPRVQKYVGGADFQNLYCMFKEQKMNLLSIARHQFKDYWGSDPFVPINWHVRRIIFEMIEDSIQLGSELLSETLQLSQYTCMGGYQVLPPGYYQVLEKCLSLINRGANVNHSDEKGHLLSKAIIFNSPELVEALLSRGASEAKKVRLYLNMHSQESHDITSILTIEANSCVELASALFRQNDGLFIVCSSFRSAVIEIFYKAGLLSGKEMITLSVESGDADLLDKCNRDYGLGPSAGVIGSIDYGALWHDLWKYLLIGSGRSLPPEGLVQRGSQLGPYKYCYDLYCHLFSEYRRKVPAPQPELSVLLFRFVYRELYDLPSSSSSSSNLSSSTPAANPPAKSGTHHAPNGASPKGPSKSPLVDLPFPPTVRTGTLAETLQGPSAQEKEEKLCKKWAKRLRSWELSHKRPAITFDDVSSAIRKSSGGRLRRKLYRFSSSSIERS